MSKTYVQGSGTPITVTGIVDGAGAPVDLTSGWTVRAQMRTRPGSETLLADWSTTPTGDQQPATPGDQQVVLACPADWSRAWTWGGRTAWLHVEATETATGRVARFVECWYLDPRLVSP